MPLFINQWTQPIHIFKLDNIYTKNHTSRGECELDKDPTHVTAACNLTLSQANVQGGIDHPSDKLIRVSESPRWDGLDEFVSDRELCEECRETLPEIWPSSAQYIDTDQSEESSV